MDDVLLLLASTLLTQTPPSLLAFIKLQATHRGVWLRYKDDRALWTRLERTLPKWSLPPHMGLRRRVISGIKLLSTNCHSCAGPAPRVFMAFQARFCRRCCHRLLISDFELAWVHGVTNPPNAAYIVRFVGDNLRVRFFLRQHLPKSLLQRHKTPSPEEKFRYSKLWRGLSAAHVRKLINHMT